MPKTIALPGQLTVPQIAERYGCSVASIYRLHEENGLPLFLKRGSERGLVSTEKLLLEWEQQGEREFLETV